MVVVVPEDLLSDAILSGTFSASVETAAKRKAKK